MWRIASESDVPQIEAFLYNHVQTSMFPLANLRDFGLHGPQPRSMNIWVLGSDPRAVFAMTNEGMVLPQCPDCTDDELTSAINLIRWHKLFGVAAEAGQARRIMHLAGWEDRPATLNSDEPGFKLNLDQLVSPDTTGAKLMRLDEVDRQMTESWRQHYLVEAMNFDPERARNQAAEDIEAYSKRDSHRVLLLNGAPVAMTGFNARLLGIVQVGGVYTPPALRGRGHGRLAVAMHLAQAKEAGVTQSVLFAASDAAARAYIGIGFRPAGQFSLILFRDPEDPA